MRQGSYFTFSAAAKAVIKTAAAVKKIKLESFNLRERAESVIALFACHEKMYYELSIVLYMVISSVTYASHFPAKTNSYVVMERSSTSNEH